MQYDLFTFTNNAVTNLKKSGKEKITKNVVITRMAALDKIWMKFDNTHEQLLTVKTDIEKDNYFPIDLYSQCEDKYTSAKV